MKILVTFALDAEFAPWRRLHCFDPSDAGQFPGYRARIGGADVRVLVTGMGWANATRAARRGLDGMPDVCISSGLAGGLKPAHRPGEILAPRLVGDIEGARALRTDRDLLSAAAVCGAKVVEKFVISRSTVRASDEKREMGIFGDAVDMESFRVLEAACDRGVRSVVIRAISDPVEKNLPLDFDRAMDKKGQISVPRILGHLVMRPHRLPGLIHLGIESSRAAAALAQFLDRYVSFLGAGKEHPAALAEAAAV